MAEKNYVDDVEIAAEASLQLSLITLVFCTNIEMNSYPSSNLLILSLMKKRKPWFGNKTYALFRCVQRSISCAI